MATRRAVPGLRSREAFVGAVACQRSQADGEELRQSSSKEGDPAVLTAMLKRLRVEGPSHAIRKLQLHLSPNSPLWRIEEDASSIFNALSQGSSTIEASVVVQLGTRLAEGSPQFYALLFSVYQEAQSAPRSAVTLHREAWVRACQTGGTADPVQLAEAKWLGLQQNYKGVARVASAFNAFHRFIFIYLLVKHSSPGVTSTTTVAAPSGGGGGLFGCMDPARQAYGTFCRSVPCTVIAPALRAALHGLTPLLEPFCDFLHAERVPRMNLDQWMSIAVFARTARLDSLLTRHSLSDSWPTLLDEFVDWYSHVADPRRVLTSRADSYRIGVDRCARRCRTESISLAASNWNQEGLSDDDAGEDDDADSPRPRHKPCLTQA